MGDIGETVGMLIYESPDLHYIVTLKTSDDEFVFDTDEVREQLEGTPINDFEIVQWIKEYINEGVSNIFGGVLDEIT